MHNSSRTRSALGARRRTIGIVAALTAAISVLVPATASAQEIVPGSSDINSQIQQAFNSGLAQSREDAWNIRNNLRAQVAYLGAGALPLNDAIDNTVEVIFPGLIQQKLDQQRAAEAAIAEQHAAQQRAQEEATRAARFDRGSCPVTADVCVDIDGGRSWLQSGGEVVYGAVPVSSGGRGQETPRGSFTINRKVKDEISHEFGNAPMPYAMYFTYNGHAFHQGNVATTSAGCVRLSQQDAIHYFNNVDIGDTVYIY
ncbi:L,D-transpeptidase [Corynebacterium pacaense]|uniref:L,D-transpeptidase n=1 Tax=Corynebacterium pacaense TaxID=1816684 RepID=UPI0009BB5CD4|nr:L,D-transpeptidase family protein [Corynebacterium pacaense]